jgi:hypothetical protein
MAVVNHPFYGNEEAGDALAWDKAAAETVQFDAAEVWNSMWLTRHEITPPYEPDNHLAVRWWEQTFGPTKRGAALGGSDNHWRTLDGNAGVGQPTTWVYAPDRSAAGLIAGVQAGRTTISWQPPSHGGPLLLLDVVEETSGRAAMLGGTVRAEGQSLAVATISGGAGMHLRLVAGGPGRPSEVVGERRVLLPSQRVELPVVLAPDGWLRAELLLEERLALTALTSCIYAQGRVPAGERREVTRGRPVTYDGSGFAAMPVPAGAAGLPACSCAH